MHYQRRQFLILGAGAALLPSFTRIARPADVIFPGATWEKAAPADVGWSIDKLEMARQFFQSLPPASMVVVHRGRVIVEWGDPAKRIKESATRGRGLLRRPERRGTPLRCLIARSEAWSSCRMSRSGWPPSDLNRLQLLRKIQPAY